VWVAMDSSADGTDGKVLEGRVGASTDPGHARTGWNSNQERRIRYRRRSVMSGESATRALYALNGLLVKLRAESLELAGAVIISDGLDVAEHLVRLIEGFGDGTGAESEFRRHLADLAQTYPELGIGLARFDVERAPDSW